MKIISPAVVIETTCTSCVHKQADSSERCPPRWFGLPRGARDRTRATGGGGEPPDAAPPGGPQEAGRDGSGGCWCMAEGEEEEEKHKSRCPQGRIKTFKSLYNSQPLHPPVRRGRVVQSGRPCRSWSCRGRTRTRRWPPGWPSPRMPCVSSNSWWRTTLPQRGRRTRGWVAAGKKNHHSQSNQGSVANLNVSLSLSDRRPVTGGGEAEGRLKQPIAALLHLWLSLQETAAKPAAGDDAATSQTTTVPARCKISPIYSYN